MLALISIAKCTTRPFNIRLKLLQMNVILNPRIINRILIIILSILIITLNGGLYRFNIDEALTQTDIDIAKHITSIMIVSDLSDICGRPDAIACTISVFNDTNDKLEYSRIYMSDFKSYIGCKTFRRTLYHEIGHVAYGYYFGGKGNDSEIFADKYADRFEKDRCYR